MDAKTSRKPQQGWRVPLWERQDGETDRAFNGFATFRDLGPARTLAQAGRILGTSKAACEQWSSKWGWVERSSAWDDEADRNQRERDLVERREARRKMLDTHARIGIALQEVGAQALREYDTSNSATADQARARISAMRPTDLVRLLEAGTKIERHARGDRQDRVSERDATAWIAGFVDLALDFMEPDRQEAFLVQLDARLGLGELL